VPPAAGSASSSATEIALAQAIRERIEQQAPLAIRGRLLDRALLAAVYRRRQFAPLWSMHPDWSTALLAELASSALEGIAPGAADPAALPEALGDAQVNAEDRELVQMDSFLRYAALLSGGRVAAAEREPDWILPAPTFDPVTAVDRLARAGPAAALEAQKPASADYARLRVAFGRYRMIALAGGWASLPPATRAVVADRGPKVIALRQRLAAEGYLPADHVAGDVFDIDLAVAVMAFQSHHGLVADGRIGPLTLAALNVSAAERASQIRLNLERWREMPRFWPNTRVEVSVPAQSLTFYRDSRPMLTSRVIVGDAKHPTPVLAALIERVVLDPAWNVPPSIVASEIQPRLSRDPGYLARNHMIILGRGKGDSYGRDLDWHQTSVLGMGWRLRQLPGPWNALGSVVLDMPNALDVYLHDTPARNLFALPSRALSHGCVRVEEARALAALVIGLPALPAPGGETRPMPLAAPVPVFLLYQTAFTDEDGSVEFRDDLYGRDERLAIALADADQQVPVWPAEAAMSCPSIAQGLADLASSGIGVQAKVDPRSG
jgi:murein L,D-transpeptidase YcbB/YkuD